MSDVILTDYEKILARHALGLPNAQNQSYRNRFICGAGHGDFLAWDGMASADIAIRHRFSRTPVTEFIYSLTHAGAQAALLNGESLDPEDFLTAAPSGEGKAAPTDDLGAVAKPEGRSA